MNEQPKDGSEAEIPAQGKASPESWAFDAESYKERNRGQRQFSKANGSAASPHDTRNKTTNLR